MPARKRGRGRSRSSSRSSTAYNTAVARSRSRSLTRTRARSTVRVQGVHTFSRRCARITEEMNGLFLARNYEVSMSDVVQSSDFSQLFDTYRIRKVTFTIQMLNVPDVIQGLAPGGSGINDGRVNPTNWFPKVWYVVDHDGGATETLDTIRERQGVKCCILQPNKQLKISFKPMCRTLTYSTPTSTGYAPKNIKIDMSDINVEHYGLHVVFDSNGLDPLDTFPFKFVVERKLFFSCGGVR